MAKKKSEKKSGKNTNKHTGKQAGKQAGMQVGKQSGKQAAKERLEMEDFEELAEMVSNTLEKNGITPEQMLEAMKELHKDGLASFYDKNYKYKKPDYSKMVEPLHPAIEPIATKKEGAGITDLIDEALSELKKEEPEVAGKALVNALYYILANQKQLVDTHTKLSVIAILHIMTVLGVKGATPAVLELLRQDGKFMTYYVEIFDEEISFAISKLCVDDLKLLEDIMYETELIYVAQCIVADGVTHMALMNPEMRDEIIAWWSRVLTQYAKIKMDDASIDHIAWTIFQLGAKELKPLVERLYSIKDVPFLEVSDYDELETLLDEGITERRIEIDSIGEIITNLERAIDEDDDWLDDYDYDDEDEALPFAFKNYKADEDGEEDDFDDADDELVDEQYDGMVYRLEISIDECPVNVVREVLVPSNIRLNWLGKVLVEAMGWNGYHLNQFIKGNAYYADEVDTFFGTETYQSAEYALNEILSRKGTKIKWEYDFGDGWMHTIKLLEKIKYEPSMNMVEVTRAENACPPDDCGGVWGYENLLIALKDKKHPEHRMWKDWVGRGFNPHKVSLDDLNSRLDRLQIGK